MLSLGADALISKSFGLMGVLKLTPYGGYSLTSIYATSHVVSRFDEGETTPIPYTLADQYLFVHRGILGAALQFSVAEIAMEMVMNGTTTTTGIRIGAMF